MMNYLSNKLLLAVIGIVILVVAIPASLYLVRQQQTLRSKAAVGDFPGLVLSPLSATKAVNDTFDVNLLVNGGSEDVSSVDIQLTFNKDVLEIQQFTPSSSFAPIISNPYDNSSGQVHIISVNPTNTPNTGQTTVGTIRFRAKALGVSPVNFGQSNITVASQNQLIDVPFANNSNGLYTVSTGPSATPFPTQVPSSTPAPSSTPPPSPTPTPTRVACTNLSIDGSQTVSIPPSGASKNISVGFTPIDATVSFSAPGLNPREVRFGSGPADRNWVVDIPANINSTENVYTINATISSGGANFSCPTPITVRVAPSTLDNACPPSIQSTQVKFRSIDNTGSWVATKNIALGEGVSVAGFHNNDTPDSPPGDTDLSVSGPSGFSRVFTGSNIFTFTPSDDVGAGTYIFSATTRGRVGPNCVGTGTLNVSPRPSPTPRPTAVLLTPVTTLVRIAESRGGLDDNSGQFVEAPYTQSALTLPYSFKDKSLGTKQIWVKFFGRGSSGENTVSEPQGPFEIEIVSPDPTFNVTGGGVACDLSVDGGVRFTLTGKYFGAAQGRNGSVKSGQNALRIDSWGDTTISGTLDQSGANGQDFPVILTRDDGAATDSTICSVATSALQLGANFFCRQSLNQNLSNVELTIAEGRQGGNVNSETVSVGTNGLITGLKTRFQQGKPYKIGIKAPGTLRRVAEFTANRGTTKIASLDLPVGDIFPLNGDGKINSADYAELLREWALNATTGGRSGDLNQDGRVNSFDWACMRPYFDKIDDPQPEAGPLSQGCAQVVTAAVNANTGVCQQFPTPCDVPSGWNPIGGSVCRSLSPTPTLTTVIDNFPTLTPIPTLIRSNPTPTSSQTSCSNSGNSCSLNITDGQTLSTNGGCVPIFASGVRSDPSYYLSVWFLNSNAGDFPLFNVQSDSTLVGCLKSGAYNNGPATIQCRVSSAQSNGAICASRNYNVNISN